MQTATTNRKLETLWVMVNITRYFLLAILRFYNQKHIITTGEGKQLQFKIYANADLYAIQYSNRAKISMFWDSRYYCFLMMMLHMIVFLISGNISFNQFFFKIQSTDQHFHKSNEFINNNVSKIIGNMLSRILHLTHHGMLVLDVKVSYMCVTVAVIHNLTIFVVLTMFFFKKGNSYDPQSI